MMDHEGSCGFRTLAKGPACIVQRCRCGVVLVHAGPITLRFDRRTLEAVWRTLGQALDKDAELEQAPRWRTAHAWAAAGPTKGRA